MLIFYSIQGLDFQPQDRENCSNYVAKKQQ